MLIIVLAICAALAVLGISLIFKRSALAEAKKNPLSEWCRYDYLRELRERKLSPERIADLEDTADRACECGLGMVNRLDQPLTPEDLVHIRTCDFCQYVLALHEIELPPPT